MSEFVGARMEGEFGGTPERSVWPVLSGCMWVLMLSCFMLPGRVGPAVVEALDLVALLKLAARGGVSLVLVGLLLRNWHLAQRQRVLASLTFFGIFVAWAAMSTFWSPLKSISLGQAFSLAVLFLLTLNVGLFCRGERATSALLRSLTAGLLACSTIVLLTNLLLPEYGSLNRFSPGIVHPTTAASTASLGLVMLVSCRLLWGWKWTRVPLVPGGLVCILLLLFAANRTSTFLSALLLVILSVAFCDRRVLPGLLVIGSLCATAYLVLDPHWNALESTADLMLRHIKRGEDQALQNFSGRSEMWEAMWKSYLDSPWVGHGYFVTSARGELNVWGVWLNWTAHNVALQALVTTGLVGVFLLAAGLGIPFANAWRWRSWSKHHQKAVRLVFLSGFWFFVWGLFNESWLGPLEPESVVFFALVGLAVGLVPCYEAGTAVRWAAAGVRSDDRRWAESDSRWALP